MTDAVREALGAAAPGARFEMFESPAGPAQEVAIVAPDEYHDLVAAAREAGFAFFSDLCAVDYLRREPRFEVVVVLLAHELRRRLRIRVGVPAAAPVLASITDLYTGANFYEREAYDLFGIAFAGHPDLTRILLPDDWEGHPLRKDYAVGSVPVQFKEAHHAR
jgi:NADH-quinone oxidoreductase subunit C